MKGVACSNTVLRLGTIEECESNWQLANQVYLEMTIKTVSLERFTGKFPKNYA